MAEVEAVRSNDLLGQVVPFLYVNAMAAMKYYDFGQVFPLHVARQLLDGGKMVAESHE